MEIENIPDMEEIENKVENILIIEELGKLAVNDYNKFSVICMESYDNSYIAWGIFERDKEEDSARELADMMATKAAEFNYYDEGGEILISGAEFYVYDSEGKRIHTGQNIEYLVN